MGERVKNDFDGDPSKLLRAYEALNRAQVKMREQLDDLRRTSERGQQSEKDRNNAMLRALNGQFERSGQILRFDKERLPLLDRSLARHKDIRDNLDRQGDISNRLLTSLKGQGAQVLGMATGWLSVGSAIAIASKALQDHDQYLQETADRTKELQKSTLEILAASGHLVGGEQAVADIASFAGVSTERAAASLGAVAGAAPLLNKADQIALAKRSARASFAGLDPALIGKVAAQLKIAFPDKGSEDILDLAASAIQGTGDAANTLGNKQFLATAQTLTRTGLDPEFVLGLLTQASSAGFEVVQLQTLARLVEQPGQKIVAKGRKLTDAEEAINRFVDSGPLERVKQLIEVKAVRDKLAGGEAAGKLGNLKFESVLELQRQFEEAQTQDVFEGLIGAAAKTAGGAGVAAQLQAEAALDQNRQKDALRSQVRTQFTELAKKAAAKRGLSGVGARLSHQLDRFGVERLGLPEEAGGDFIEAEAARFQRAFPTFEPETVAEMVRHLKAMRDALEKQEKEALRRGAVAGEGRIPPPPVRPNAADENRNVEN